MDSNPSKKNPADERASRMAMLLEVQQSITSRLNLESVLQLIADEARRLTDAQHTAVFLVNGDALHAAITSGESQAGEPVGLEIPLKGSLIEQALRLRKPMVVRGETGDFPQPDEAAQARPTPPVSEKERLIVPLVAGEAPIGAISISLNSAGSYSQEDEQGLMLLAASAVIGLENARLYRQEQERRKENERRRHVAEGLRDILLILNSNRPLSEVLPRVVEHASHLLSADATLLYRLEQDNRRYVIEASYGLPADLAVFQCGSLYPSAMNLALLDRKPVHVADVGSYVSGLLRKPNLGAGQRAWYQAIAHHYQSYFAAPVIVKDKLYGGMIFYYKARREFSREDHTLSSSLCDHAALAIENAALRAQLEETAAAAERSRLARELHDAVTQTLFSASLIAEVLPRLWERNQQEGRRRLEELRRLTRGALAEMRTLLLELRPTSLVEVSHTELFRQLTEAFTGKLGIPAELQLAEIPDLPSEVKVALYRITQEGLNNISKHAQASHVSVSLRLEKSRQEEHLPSAPQRLVLEIRDDGRGFQPERVPPGHLGLGIMRERAAAIGAQFELQSAPGQGAAVRVTWPAGPGEHKQPR